MDVRQLYAGSACGPDGEGRGVSGSMDYSTG